MNDNIKITGQFNIRVVKDTEVIEEYTDNNMVLMTGRSALAHALASGQGTQITKIVLGTGGHDENNPTSAKEGLSVNDTGLIAPHTEKVLTDVTSLNNVLTIKATLASSEGLTGNAPTGFSEAALVLNNNALFSIKRFGIKTKTADTSFEITWKVTF